VWKDALQHVERLPPDVRDRRRLEILLSLASSLLPLGRVDEAEKGLLAARAAVFEGVSADAELLVFIHGTGSSTAGSFGELRRAAAAAEWAELRKRFGAHVYGFEHRTFSESPIDNAIALATALPEGGFYFWIRTPIDDAKFAQALHRTYNVTVLPGSFLARDVHGANPGRNHIRVALVAPPGECLEGIRRIGAFARSL